MNYGCLVREIIPAVVRERQYQEEKYPEPKRSVTDFVLAIQNELDEVRMAWGHESHEALMAEILQVVTLGVAAMEQFGVHERPALRRSLETGQDAGAVVEKDLVEVALIYTKSMECFGLVELFRVLKLLVSDDVALRLRAEAGDEEKSEIKKYGTVTVLELELWEKMMRQIAIVEPFINQVEKAMSRGRSECLVGISKMKGDGSEEEL